MNDAAILQYSTFHSWRPRHAAWAQEADEEMRTDPKVVTGGAVIYYNISVFLRTKYNEGRLNAAGPGGRRAVHAGGVRGDLRHLPRRRGVGGGRVRSRCRFVLRLIHSIPHSR